MSKKNLPATTDQHSRLVTEALPLAVNVLIETMQLSSFDENQNPETGEVERTFNGRIHSQKIRAANGTLTTLVKLGDQSVKRQVGSQLKHLLAAIKKEKKAKTIEATPELP